MISICTQSIRFRFTLTLILLLVAGCAGSPQHDGRHGEPEISGDEIRSAAGELLLHIDDIPRNIRTDHENEFGASERFVEVSQSPDNNWLAVTTSSAAHSAGWLIHSDNMVPVPAAFQYGGSVKTGPWNEDSQFISFISETPAPSSVLSVVNLDSLGPTVSHHNIQIRIPGHEVAVPPGTTYIPEKWTEKRLFFSVNGDRYVYDTFANDISDFDDEIVN
jgi:hypothetical protein